ncbi:leucyl/cytosol aminopeptidase [Gluconacetobacter johannae DSM 13595]|uniref:Probable cytosol aminopeptidase n=1 Tax=Gluconacetobacter johannae TaxID=112140 RepID=A0A7W4J9K7_9PROT|nr:leucyl aminopeptidase [Gluconacetobacter johannae]MBB2177083.1 leucyl aminopeptidase [Gluconacetobacter johannae]GBQ88322.1 leucyl/cytosol aminopeptidase [Gluconacetobacter johannae DSM 13595]
MLQIQFSAADLPAGGVLALLTPEDGPRPPLFAAADAATGGALSRAVAAAAFGFGSGRTCMILAPGGGFDRILLVGLGKSAEIGVRTVEAAAGAAVTALGKLAEAATIAADGVPGALVAHVAHGGTLAAYRFDHYQTRTPEDARWRLDRLDILTPAAAHAAAAWTGLSAVTRGVCLTRDLVSEPANALRPPEFAQRIEALRELGVEVEVLDGAAMAELGFGALLGVAQGSDAPPRTVLMRWNGAGTDEAPLAFIGKGVTFDSGGISIKPAGGMEEMKTDMAGAAAVVGLMAALAGRKARVNVVGAVGLVENMLAGNAQRPGDVVRTCSGQTIEVINTDAEGRLVLADVLWYVQDRFRPRLMVDLATLTGAIVVGLGHEYAGLFANDDALAQRLSAAGEETGERLWRMPLADAYREALRSDIADLKNVGGRPAGAITAAKFLEYFVNQVPWAHLDIAGTAWAKKAAPCTPKGASGFGVRLLDQFVREHYEG